MPTRNGAGLFDRCNTTKGISMPMPENLARLEHRLAVARGDIPAELLIRNTRVLNVLSGEIHSADVAIADGVFTSFSGKEGRRVIDAKGRYLCPGLIDGHIHIESTLLSPPVFARAVAPHGPARLFPTPMRSPTYLVLRDWNICWPAAAISP